MRGHRRVRVGGRVGIGQGDAVKRAASARSTRRGRFRFSGTPLSDMNGEIEVMGDMRDWMWRSEAERCAELFRIADEKLAAMRSGPHSLRRPRTALGHGLLGPAAPPAFSVSFRLTDPGARTYDPRSLRLTMPDGTVFTGDMLCRA